MQLCRRVLSHSHLQLCRRVLSHSHRWFSTEPFVFTSANYCDPELPHGLTVVEVPLVEATDEALSGLGRLVHAADDCTVERGNFEICRWPQHSSCSPMHPLITTLCCFVSRCSSPLCLLIAACSLTAP